MQSITSDGFHIPSYCFATFGPVCVKLENAMKANATILKVVVDSKIILVFRKTVHPYAIYTTIYCFSNLLIRFSNNTNTLRHTFVHFSAKVSS